MVLKYLYPNNKVEKLITELLKKTELNAVGLGARDTLRLEAGLCLYGHELNEDINPIEANLKWAIAKEEEKRVVLKVGKKSKRLIENGVSKIRVGIKP